ncbi:MAG: FimB/Mfa2 family fimbrial subunit [Prevotellaceae bacterium]|nr:FimB/Mfa2 family fimbrial subunit [Prevotellaceae bacterium]
MNKKVYVFTLAAGMLLAACGEDKSAVSPSDGTVTLSFRVSNYVQADMDDTGTRSTDVSNLKHLSLGVYDAETLELAQDVMTQSSGDADYGTFSVTLPYGEYKLVFLGYHKDAEVDMSDPEAITFGYGYVPHTFLKTVDLTVDGETSTSQTVALERAVGEFKVYCYGCEEIPTQTITFSISVTGSGTTLNALTGLAPEAGEKTFSLQTAHTLGVSSIYEGIYLLLPTGEETTIDCTMTAYGVDGSVLGRKSFADVPVKINRLTTYTGDFFNSDASKSGFSIELADDYDVWGETVDGTY